MPRQRFQTPDRLMGATAFSQDRSLNGGMQMVRLVKHHRWLSRDLRRRVRLASPYGRQRLRGRWELIAVAFVASDYIDIQPWYDESTDSLWHACGFIVKPSYRTTWRLRELAGVADEFLIAAGKLIRRARDKDPRVMAHVHFDNTEDETHAALVHDCSRDECPQRRPGQQGHASGRGRAGAGQRPQRQATKAFREERHQLAALDPETVEREEAGHVPDRVEVVQHGNRRVKRVKVGGCWYRTLDLDAGIRAYMGPRGAKRFWHGYYSGKAVDHFTGGVIPIVESASLREHTIFEKHYDLVCDLAGAAPQTAIGDKGLSIASAFKKCTTNGTAPVFPWRAGGGDYKRHDHDTHDRHGVPRCKHCGGPTDFVRFSAGDRSRAPEDRHPRLWARCMAVATPECEQEQTIACEENWRLLIPLWRTEELYHELKESHSTYEAHHDYWRDRYKVAADDIGIRPKVRDIDFHRLRANVACLIEWLRICVRQGWLGDAPRNRRGTERKFKDRAERIAVRFAEMRHRMGLMGAYGEKAVRLFPQAQVTPPSRRPRGEPPGQTQLDIEHATAPTNS
jgi:hypothetical protein